MEKCPYCSQELTEITRNVLQEGVMRKIVYLWCKICSYSRDVSSEVIEPNAWWQNFMAAPTSCNVEVE